MVVTSAARLVSVAHLDTGLPGQNFHFWDRAVTLAGTHSAGDLALVAICIAAAIGADARSVATRASMLAYAFVSTAVAVVASRALADPPAQVEFDAD